MREILKNKPAIVYCAVNSINGKKYIGITSQTLQKRKFGHLNGSKQVGKLVLFHKAINKYGFEKFNWYILSKWDYYQDALNEEIRVIDLIKSEYNMTKGGDGVLGSVGAWRGKNLTKLSIEKRTATRRKTGAAKSVIGPFNKKSNIFNHNGKRYVICVDDGNRFSSLRDAARFYNVSSSHISEVCSGKRKTIWGKKFKYIEKNKRYFIPRVLNKTKRVHNKIKIICVTDGFVFDSSANAARYYKISKATVCLICKKKQNKTKSGLTFKYLEDSK